MAMRSIADPVRIAILGGGVAALSAAYELSHSRQQGRFKVTVYQMGWRLGGKCASGRDLDTDKGMRIKEHGPHLLFGFYDNGFEMMDECYADLQRPVGHPFRSFMDALIGSNDCCVMENIAGVWSPWQVPAFALPGKPGADGALSRWQVALNAINRLAEHIDASGDVFDDARRGVDKVDVEKAFQSFDALLNRHCNARLAAESKNHLARNKADDDAHRGLIVIRGALRLMKASAAAAQERAQKIEIKNGQVPHDDALALAEHLRCLQQLIQYVGTFFERGDDDVRHWIILGDLGATVLLGATLGELLLPTRQSLLAANKFEYQDWLRHFHAMENTINSAIVTAMYDTVFGYVGGDIQRGCDVEAGSAVRAQLDMVSCRGSFFWKMRAGTGDVIAAPLYERLKAQGVDFQFFSQVVDVIPLADGPSVAEVHIVRQAEVLNQPYRPLLECKGIPVWPDRPELNQLKNGQSYKNVDFESYPVPENAHRLVLKADDDFDAVVLGIGLGALPSICKRLRQVNNNWDDMLTKGRTVATQSLQLWISQGTKASGWPGPPRPVVTSFDASPLDTWLDASHAIEFENWTSKTPAQMAMICGPFPGLDQNNREEVKEAIARNASKFLETSCSLWPRFCNRGVFDQGLLRARYSHPGVNPSDRYVQTPRDSSRFRLSPGQSGFGNMVLAGDWTDYGMNLGCFEGAVVSGRLAANALGGQPRRILREDPSPSMSNAGRLYVDHNPPQSMAGPIAFPGVTMWTFFLRGDIEKLTGLCRRFFDIPTGGRITFSPLSQAVIMTISELPNAYFVDHPDRGKSTEREVAFGIPGEYTCRDSAGKVTESGIATFMPYLFVDNPVALITGREVLGYFKQLGEVGLPGRAGGREDFFLNVFGAERMAAGVEWGEQRLLTVTARDPLKRRLLRPADPGPLKTAGNFSTVTSSIQTLLKSVLGSRLPGRTTLGIGDVRGLLTGSLSQIFLKQFRAEAGNAAAYQAVTMAEYRVSSINDIRSTQSFDIVIRALQSLPIATELGLNSPMVETGIEVNFDMTLGRGRVLWQG